MVDDRPEDTGSLPDSEPAEARAADHRSRGDRSVERDEEFWRGVVRAEAERRARGRRSAVEEARRLREPPSRPVSPWIVAPVSGAVAAALVIGVGWMLGWPAIQPASAPPAPQLSAAIDGLTARVAGLEPKVGKPVRRSRGRRAHRGSGKIGRRVARRTRGDAGARREARVRHQRCEIRAARRRHGGAGSLRRSMNASRRSRARCGRRAPRSRSKAARSPIPRRPTPSLPTICRCAAWWRRRCSMFWSGSAIPIRRRLRRRRRWRPIPMR